VAKLFQFTLEKQTYQKITQLFCPKNDKINWKKFIKLNFLSKNVAYESYTDYPIHTILRIKDSIKMLFSCLILIYYMSLLILIFQYLKEISIFQYFNISKYTTPQSTIIPPKKIIIKKLKKTKKKNKKQKHFPPWYLQRNDAWI
jgi:hypothetical protein